MALVKKGSRSITVDGVTYRWRVRRRPTLGQAMAWFPLTYAVELAEAPGRTLVVTTSRPHPGNWVGAPAVAVLPQHVTASIRAALAKGWVPENHGSPFHLDRSEGFVASA